MPDPIPAPRVPGPQVGAAEPAVEPEQLDAIGVAAEHAFARIRQPEANRAEAAAVAERRRHRQRATVVVFHEPDVPAAEPGERPEEPGVAQKGRLLELLRRHERRRRGGRARRDRLERSALRSGEAVARRGQLLKQARSSAPRSNSSGPAPPARPPAPRIGARNASQASQAAASISGVARCRPGQSVSSCRRPSSPSPRNDGLPGNDETTISSAATDLRPRAQARRSAAAGRTGRARTRGRRGTPSRSARLSWRSPRSSEERIALRFPQPQPERNAAAPSSSSWRGTAGTGPSWRTSSRATPLRRWRSPAGCCLRFPRSSRAARRPHRRLPPPGKIGRAAGAVVEGVARAADHAASSSRIRRRPAMPVSISSISRPSGRAASLRASRIGAPPEVFADLGQGEADGLRLLDRTEEPHGVLVVAAVAAGLPVRGRQEPAALVEAERLDVHPRAPRDLADLHRPTIDPYLEYGESSRRGGARAEVEHALGLAAERSIGPARARRRRR